MLLCGVTFGPSIWKDLAFFNFLGPSWDTIVNNITMGVTRRAGKHDGQRASGVAEPGQE